MNISADNILKCFFLTFPENGFDISCKLPPQEKIRMKCQILFCGKKRKIRKIIHLLSSEFTHSMLRVNTDDRKDENRENGDIIKVVGWLLRD